MSRTRRYLAPFVQLAGGAVALVAFAVAPPERGDLLFHDAYLWHSAARATVDTAIRRHVRGGWFSGQPDAENSDYVEDFIKNAAR